MSGGFPLVGGLANGQSISANTSVGGHSRGVALTVGANSVKGSYLQLIASTSSDSVFMLIELAPDDGGNTGGCSIDIAIGGAGSETIICADLVLDGQAGNFVYSYAFPLCIPAGSRVAARGGTSKVANQTVHVNVVLFDGDFTHSYGGAVVDAIGYGGSGFGTSVAGGGVDIKGSFVQLIASTSADYIGFCISADGASAAPSFVVNALLDIAVGGAGSERVIVPNTYRLMVGESAPVNGGGAGCGSAFLPIKIPAGTRVSARQQNDKNSTIGITIYGVR